MMMVYQIKESSHLPRTLDAQAVGERIATLREAAGEGFTPELVVQDARPKKSPLHPAFTWDVQKAANERWLQQAGHLIRSIVTVVSADGEDREVRAFVPVTVREVDEQRYIPLYTAMSDEDYRRQVVETALGEMLALRRKYQDLAEFAKVFKAIDATAQRIKAA